MRFLATIVALVLSANTFGQQLDLKAVDRLMNETIRQWQIPGPRLRSCRTIGSCT